MKTTLYIVRHGETLWNSEKKMQGWNDSPLTELGIKQATWLGERLKEVKFDNIYSSPTGRSFKTAALVNKNRSISVTLDECLREINLGSWEGKSIEEIERENPEQLNNFWKAPHLYVPVSGESFKDVQDRVIGGLKSIIEANEGKTILLVTHTVALKTIMCYFENRSLEKFWDPPYIHQTSLSVVEIDGEKIEIKLHGDTAHYKKEELKENKAV